MITPPTADSIGCPNAAYSNPMVAGSASTELSTSASRHAATGSWVNAASEISMAHSPGRSRACAPRSEKDRMGGLHLSLRMPPRRLPSQDGSSDGASGVRESHDPEE